MSDFSSGHDLIFRGFEPHIGLCAESSEPGACFRSCVSLSLCPSLALSLSLSLSQKINLGRWSASNFSSGHDLSACEFEPRIGLCADSSEPVACFGFCVSLSLCPFPARSLSLCLSKTSNIKQRRRGRQEAPRQRGFIYRPQGREGGPKAPRERPQQGRGGGVLWSEERVHGPLRGQEGRGPCPGLTGQYVPELGSQPGYFNSEVLSLAVCTTGLVKPLPEGRRQWNGTDTPG